LDILFDTAEWKFSYRVAAIVIKDGKLLLQKPEDDDGFAFIGGHVAFGETGAQALTREFQEELGLKLQVGSLAAVGEIRFLWGKPCQQIGLYYRAELPGIEPWEGPRFGWDEVGGQRTDLGFYWVPVEAIRQGTVKIYPPQLLGNLEKKELVHFVYNELE